MEFRGESENPWVVFLSLSDGVYDKEIGFPCGSAGKESIHLQCRRPGFDPWAGKIPWRRERLPTPVFWPGEFHEMYTPWGRDWATFTFICMSILKCSYWKCQSFPGGSVLKNLPTDTGDSGLIPGSGRSPGERNSYPRQYPCLRRPIKVTKSQIWLSNQITTENVTILSPEMMESDHQKKTLQGHHLWMRITVS